MKPSDILNRAAEVMIERGHGKRVHQDSQGRVCVEGACKVAAGLHALETFEPEPVIAYRYITQAVGQTAYEWNDLPETTEAMAIGALHEAALLAKEAGQ